MWGLSQRFCIKPKYFSIGSSRASEIFGTCRRISGRKPETCVNHSHKPRRAAAPKIPQSGLLGLVAHSQGIPNIPQSRLTRLGLTSVYSSPYSSLRQSLQQSTAVYSSPYISLYSSLHQSLQQSTVVLTAVYSRLSSSEFPALFILIFAKNLWHIGVVSLLFPTCLALWLVPAPPGFLNCFVQLVLFVSLRLSHTSSVGAIQAITSDDTRRYLAIAAVRALP